MYHASAHKIKPKFALRREKKRKKGNPSTQHQKNAPAPSEARLVLNFGVLPAARRDFASLCSAKVRRAAVSSGACCCVWWGGGRAAAPAPSRRPAAPVLLSSAPPAQPRRCCSVLLLVSGWRSWLRCENLRSVRRWVRVRGGRAVRLVRLSGALFCAGGGGRRRALASCAPASRLRRFAWLLAFASSVRASRRCCPVLLARARRASCALGLRLSPRLVGGGWAVAFLARGLVPLPPPRPLGAPPLPPSGSPPSGGRPRAEILAGGGGRARALLPLVAVGCARGARPSFPALSAVVLPPAACALRLPRRVRPPRAPRGGRPRRLVGGFSASKGG